VEGVGRVVRKRVAAGTKSERDAVVFVTGSGEYALRRRGGNPFHDPALERLVGKRIRATGVVHAGNLIMSDWAELEPSDRGGG
jgi:hypothetical protein